MISWLVKQADSFTLRRHKKTLVAARDEHSVAGTWELPFAFLLALTGAFFSFALSFGLPIMSLVAFRGDQAKLRDTLVGAPAAEGARPAEVANLDTMIRDAQARVGGSVNRVSITHYGRKDGEVMIGLDPVAGALEPSRLVYKAPDGAFVMRKTRIGIVFHYRSFALWQFRRRAFQAGLACTRVRLFLCHRNWNVVVAKAPRRGCALAHFCSCQRDGYLWSPYRAYSFRLWFPFELSCRDCGDGHALSLSGRSVARD